MILFLFFNFIAYLFFKILTLEVENLKLKQETAQIQLKNKTLEKQLKSERLAIEEMRKIKHAHDEKLENEKKIIKQALKTNACSVSDLPDVVVERLRNASN